MVGVLLQECVKDHNLDNYKSWSEPNLPRGSDNEITYFLPKGNLMLRIDNQEKITFSTFYRSDKSAEKRLEQVHAGWHEWVEAHTIKETQQDGGANLDR